MSTKRADYRSMLGGVSIGVGIPRAPGQDGYTVALFLRSRKLRDNPPPQLTKAIDFTRKECEIRVVNRIRTGTSTRVRPLRPGLSIGHYRVTA